MSSKLRFGDLAKFVSQILRFKSPFHARSLCVYARQRVFACVLIIAHFKNRIDGQLGFSFMYLSIDNIMQ